MSSRTRRGAQQPAAGGILASLNVNIPAVKSRGVKENGELPSSVVVSKTQHLPLPSSNERVTRNESTLVHSFENDGEDDMSAISCDLSSQSFGQPLSHSKNQEGLISFARQKNLTSEDFSFCPSSHEQEEATVDSSMTNEKDSESEASESILDCNDELIDDDDEYNPDEDYDSDSEEDLEFVEEDIAHSPLFKPRLQGRKSRERNKGHVDGNADEFTPKEIASDSSEKMESSIQSMNSDDDSTVIEHTPVAKSSRFSPSTMSPESQLAEVVDDDASSDGDVPVATIIDGALKSETSVSSSKDLARVTIPSSKGERDWFAQGRPDDSGLQRAGQRMEDLSQTNEKDSFNGIHQGGDTVEISSTKNGEPDACEPNYSNSNEPVPYHTPIQKKSRTRKKSLYQQKGKVKRGKWTLGAKIGVGSFGVVHIGMNTVTGSLMAVKAFKVDEAITQDVRREIELMRLLKHQNIVQYLGAQRDKSNLYIFQEWVPGGSVASMLSRFGAFPLQVIQRYLSQALLGLQYLHENNIIHRDIKGSNILINDEGVVKLADFGASKKMSNLQGDMMMSLTVRGTPYFMAPEVYEERYSSKADLWGIGCVAYQMITASPPWKDHGFTNPISLFNHIKRSMGPPKLPRSVPRSYLDDNPDLMHAFDMLMKKCFEREPSARPSARDLLTHDFFHVEIGSTPADDDSHHAKLFSPNSQIQSPWSVRCNHADNDNNPLTSRSISPIKCSFKQGAEEFASNSKQARSSGFGISGYPNNANSSGIVSPQRDVSDWPEWARDQFGRGERVHPSQENALSHMMGSLALSEDSTQRNPFAATLDSQECTALSNLIGLRLIDGKCVTRDY